MKVFIFLILTIFFGCTKKESEYVIKHEGPKTAYQNKELLPLGENIFPTIDELNIFYEHTVSRNDILNNVLIPLSGYVLDKQKIRNSQFTSVSEAIRIFNDAIIIALSKGIDLGELLENYVDVLMHGCDKLLNHCANIGVFRNANNTSEVLKILAIKEDNDPERFFNFLSMAYDMKGTRYDPELDKLYLKNFKRLESLINGINNVGFRNQILSKHSNILFSVTQNYIDKSGDILPLVSQFNLWGSSTYNFIDNFKQVKNMLLKELLSKHLYENHGYEKNSGKINPFLFKQMKMELSSNQSINFKLNNLKNERPFLFKNLNLKEFEINEYFILVDKIFNSNWELDVAKALWDSSTKDTEVLLSTMKNYVMVQLALMIVETNNFFKEKFYDKNSFDNENMFWKALEASDMFSSRWHSLIRKFQHLYEFSNTISYDNYSKKAKVLFESIGKNIKFMVVYPNMMLLSYKLSESSFNKEFRTIFGTFRVDSRLIFKLFFDGKFSPWFDFGNDSEPLNKYSIIHAFDYALKTEIFQTYGISPYDFINRAYEELLRPKQNRLISEHSKLKSDFQSDSNFERFINTCRSIKEGTPYYNPLRLAELKYSPFLGRWGGSNYATVGEASRNVYKNSNISNIEWIRTDLNYEILSIGSMIKIYESHLQDIEKITDKSLIRLKKILRDLKIGISSYFRDLIYIHNRFSECESIMFKRDIEIQKKLYMAEINYLKRVFRDITDYREGKLKEPIIYENNYLAGRNNVFDHFDKNFFYYNRLNMFFKIKDYLKIIDPYTEIIVPANIEIDSELGKFFKTPDIRLVAYVDRHDSYELNETEFIANTLSNLKTKNYHNSFLNWLSLTNEYLFWFQKLEFMSAMYKSFFLLDVKEDIDSLNRLTPHDFIEEIKTKIGIVNIDSTEEIILKLFKTESRFELYFYSPFDDLFIHYKTKEILPLFSSVYMLVTQGLLGSYFTRPGMVEYTTDNEIIVLQPRNTHLQEAKIFFDAVKDLEDAIIPVCSGVNVFLKNNIKKMVDWNVHVESSIRNEIIFMQDENYRLPDDKKIKLRIRLSDKPESEKFLEKFKIESFRIQMDEFHKKTQNYFVGD